MATTPLGAVSAHVTPAPAIGLAPMAPDSRYPKFDDALATYLEALRRLDSQGAGNPTRLDEDVASAAYYHAERALLDLPSQTIEEFRTKFEILWSDPQSIPSNDMVLSMFADLRRLTADAPSKVFRPEHWLRYFEMRGGMYCVRGGEVFLLEPRGDRLDDWMFELEASGGREAVFQLIRDRTGAMEATDGEG